MSLTTFYENFDNLQNMGYNVHFKTFFTSPDIWDQVWWVGSLH
jgi:hypothetical protein